MIFQKRIPEPGNGCLQQSLTAILTDGIPWEKDELIFSIKGKNCAPEEDSSGAFKYRDQFLLS